MVDELCAMIPEAPVRKMFPKPEAMEPAASAPTEVRAEPVTPPPSVVPFKTWRLLMVYALPLARFTFPAVTLKPAAKVEDAAPETVSAFDTRNCDVDACPVATRFVVVALVLVLLSMVKSSMVEVALEMSPPVNVWSPLHVGVIDWDSAGAASLRIKVLAEPFTAVRPMEAVGFAPNTVAPPAEMQFVPSVEKQVAVMPPLKVLVASPVFVN
jgi:hypothetical protein